MFSNRRIWKDWWDVWKFSVLPFLHLIRWSWCFMIQRKIICILLLLGMKMKISSLISLLPIWIYLLISLFIFLILLVLLESASNIKKVFLKTILIRNIIFSMFLKLIIWWVGKIFIIYTSLQLLIQMVKAME